jgi:hypothetical protein
MTDFENLLVFGSSPSEISKSVKSVFQALPPEMAKEFRTIRVNYLLWYGPLEANERLNNRTVAQIFSEYRPLEKKPMAAGELDGVRYELYEAPPVDSTDDERKSGE